MKRIAMLLIGMGLLASMTSAQGQGQLCVKAFDDRNANGTLDVGEPFITRDVGVRLADANGIIVQTQLLEDSQTSASGILCFAQLASAQYTLEVVSAAYNPTTNSAFVTTVSDTSIPQMFEYGAQTIAIEAVTIATPSGTLTQSQARYALEKIFVAGIGGALTIAVMVVVGAVLYLLFFRQKRTAPVPVAYPYARPDTGAYYPVRTETGSMSAVRPDTGAMAPIRPTTDTMPPATTLNPNDVPLSDDDTGRYRPPSN